MNLHVRYFSIWFVCLFSLRCQRRLSRWMIKYINEIGDFWQFLADYWVLTDWPVFRMKVILMKNPTFFHALMARAEGAKFHLARIATIGLGRQMTKCQNQQIGP